MLHNIMNKNNIIGKIKWLGNYNMEIKDINLPYFIKRLGSDWVKDRTPPKHRTHIEELLKSLNLNTTKDIIDFSKGLSLTDTFWIKSENSNLTWEDVNLYNNDFDLTISKIAFEGGLQGIHFSTTSPELTTDGMLPKCWHKDKSGIYLKKGGSDLGINSGQEPISEYIASQILKVLDYPYVHYNLEIYRNKLVSSCKLLTNEEISMIPIFYMLETPNYTSLLKYCKENNFIDDLYRIFIFDYIICNSDRHLRNIGLLFNSDTYEILGLAPIFDNGAGMLSYYVLGDDFEDYQNKYIPYLYDDFEEFTAMFKSELKVPHNIERLLEFNFKPHPLIQDEERLNFLSAFIKQRATKFLDFNYNSGFMNLDF